MMNPQGQPTPQGQMTTPQQGGEPAPTGGPTAGGSPTAMPQQEEGAPQMTATEGQMAAAQSRMGAGQPPMGPTGMPLGSALGRAPKRLPGMTGTPSKLPTLPPNVFSNSDVLKNAKKELGDSRRYNEFKYMLQKYSKKKR